jgi:hypothetical protein
VAGTIVNVAMALESQREYAKAEAFYREALSAHSRGGPGLEHALRAQAGLGRLLSDWVWAERDAKSEIGNPKPDGVERAREAEGLLRNSLSVCLGNTNVAKWRIADVKSRLGGALLAVALTDSVLDDETRESILAQAEKLLLEGNEGVQQASAASYNDKHDALERLVRLYCAWDAFAPWTGKSAHAQQWKQSLETFLARTEEASRKPQ